MRNRAARASELNLRSMMASKETRGAQAILCDIFPDGKAEGHRLANLPPSSRHFRPAPKNSSIEERTGHPRGQMQKISAGKFHFHSRAASLDHLVGASRSVAGTSRPSALAVLRLMSSSYLVGACTGKSAGFSPLRMRST